MIRFPNGALGASMNDRLAMLRNCRKTEIYSVSMVDGKRPLLFSDEGMNLEIRATGPIFVNKTYATGIVREWRTTPIPGAYDAPPALYEVALDGSKGFRRLIEIQPNQMPAVLNPQGTRAAFEGFVNDKFIVLIYDVPQWKLLRSWELTNIFQAHCPDCTPVSYGWLADGKRLFFNITVVGDDDESVHDVPGTYMISEDGNDLGGISPENGRLEFPGYVHPKYVERRLIGQLPDGGYLFEDYAAKKGTPLGKLEPFLVISSPDSKTSKAFPLKQRSTSYQLSNSGRYLE